MFEAIFATLDWKKKLISSKLFIAEYMQINAVATKIIIKCSQKHLMWQNPI